MEYGHPNATIHFAPARTQSSSSIQIALKISLGIRASDLPNTCTLCSFLSAHNTSMTTESIPSALVRCDLYAGVTTSPAVLPAPPVKRCVDLRRSCARPVWRGCTPQTSERHIQAPGHTTGNWCGLAAMSATFVRRPYAQANSEPSQKLPHGRCPSVPDWLLACERGTS